MPLGSPPAGWGSVSSDPVEVVRRMTEALSCGDTEPVGFLVAHDFAWVPHVAGFTVKEAYRGARGLREWCRLVDAMFRDYSIELEHVRELGDRVVARARQRGRVRVGRRPMDELVTIACEFRDGRLHRARMYPAWGAAKGSALEARDRAL